MPAAKPKTLLDYPQLFCGRPSTAATRVNNCKPADMASVSKVIHTDNQLQAGQFGKAAYTGWFPFNVRRGACTSFWGALRRPFGLAPVIIRHV